MRRLALAAACALAAPAPAAAAVEQPNAEERPNILVVMTDDQRAQGTLSVMPETRRRIARQGMTFLDAHATTPKCCPSRASFFTGRYAHNHDVITNRAAGRLDQRTTIQHLARKAGYRTALFGKYFNSWPVESNPPFFDEWAISNGGNDRLYWNLDGRVRTRRRYSTDLLADRALRFVRQAERRDDTQPWLMWITPHTPHTPSTPARRHRDAALPYFGRTPAMDESDWSDKPGFLDRARGFDNLIERMRDDGRRSLIAVDEMVGRLMDALRERGEYENTLVVFTSDNGFMLGEHGGLAGKDLPYRASTRIPLLIRWPGHLPAGTGTRRLVTNVDVAATLFDAAGLAVPTDGRSLLSRQRRSELFMEHHGGRNGEPDALVLPAWRSVLTPHYRYAEYRESGEVVAREYYDLEADPWELENIAGTLPSARVDELSRRLEELASCKGRSCP